MKDYRSKAEAVISRAASDLEGLAAESQDELIGEAASSLFTLGAFVLEGREVFSKDLRSTVDACHDWCERIATGGDVGLQVDTKFGVMVGQVLRPDVDGSFRVVIEGRV